MRRLPPRRGRRRPRFPALVALAGMLSAAGVAAAEPVFEVHCPTATCPAESDRARIEDFARDAWVRFSALGFPSPLPKLKKTRGADGRDRIGIEFCDPLDPAAPPRCQKLAQKTETLAQVDNPVCDGSAWPDDASTIRVRSNFFEYTEELSYYFLAHEIAHAFMLRNTEGAKQLCTEGVPEWFTEGTAVMAGYWAMEQRFGAGRPQPAWESKPARSYYGGRPYSLPLTAAKGRYVYAGDVAETILGYYTSSLWRYLAERFHDGSPAYLARYLQQAPPGCGPGQPCISGAAWLAWLDRQLRQDPAVAQGLAAVYADFLAEYATWAERRFEQLPDDGWLTTGFGDCIRREVSPEAPETTIEYDARNYAALCVQLKVARTPRDVPVRVNVAVEDLEAAGGRGWADAAHVGVARYGAPPLEAGMAESCFDRHRAAERGETACLLADVPLAGAAEPAVRNFTTAPHQAPGGRFTDTFVVTIAPDAPGSDEANEGRRRMALHFGLLLDQAVMSKGAGPTGFGDLDRAVVIELDRVNAAQIARDTTPEARRHAGANACTLAVHALNTRSRETVWLHLTRDGPIGPGLYAIGDSDSSQSAPGQAVVSFAVRDADGSMLEFKGVGGDLEIHSITRAGLLTASLRMLGYRCTDCRYKNPLSGPSNLAANAEIVATLEDPNRLIAALLAHGVDEDGTGPEHPLGSECLATP